MGNVPGTCPYTRLIRRKSLVRAVRVYLIVQRTSQAEKFVREVCQCRAQADTTAELVIMRIDDRRWLEQQFTLSQSVVLGQIWLSRC